MATIRQRNALLHASERITPSPAANDEDRMPPLWMVVTILIGYVAVIGVGLYAVLKAVLR